MDGPLTQSFILVDMYHGWADHRCNDRNSRRPTSDTQDKPIPQQSTHPYLHASTQFQVHAFVPTLTQCPTQLQKHVNTAMFWQRDHSAHTVKFPPTFSPAVTGTLCYSFRTYI